MSEVAPWGLARPTLTDAREAVHRVHADDGTAVWAHLLSSAGLSGAETDPDALEQLLGVMTTGTPTVRLCARALRIRLSSYTCLSAAHDMTSASGGRP